MITDDEAAARGRRALNELAEVSAALDAIKSGAVRMMIETSPTQIEKILRLHQTAQTMDAIHAALRDVIDNGTIAEHAISRAGLTRQTY